MEFVNPVARIEKAEKYILGVEDNAINNSIYLASYISAILDYLKPTELQRKEIERVAAEFEKQMRDTNGLKPVAKILSL